MDWQQIAVFLIVAAAVLYLAVRHFRGRKGFCDACDACPSESGKSPAPGPAPAALVQLELKPPANRERRPSA